ncbi:nitrile hydratase accessory protein [Rhodobium orientis]|uniref:Nitrile hydratase accessory protein n=1 Tax=Rhodobium orientis TaxID=34017 RepID=A0A327JJ22_9HYPH|nr:nitrile hydratase accessory protein [Rhodobium orientis]MBB4302870.1 nitrile hydratase accessory protein [Rhodobium orientis]MBK5949431.1 nitrile hydratase accessory protein [Rhodobium orientis]RAI26001.1 nitrile hydratase accessory protein [Rhodobium orientis]
MRPREASALDALPALPRDDDGPVFAEPWQASAFAMTLALSERGVFSWAEWVDTFSGELKRAAEAGTPDDGSRYYHHWLAALERLIAEKGLADPAILVDARDAWDRAAKATPHGKPIGLSPDDLARIRDAG